SAKPSTNLCSAGTASSVAGTGPWTWGCSGSNGGTTASCSASVTVSGGSTPPTTPTPTPTPTPGPVSGKCCLPLARAAVFCETFDNKNPGIPSRTGGLDPNVWGASRIMTTVNLGGDLYNGWASATQLQSCNGTVTVAPPNEIAVCNGQLREAVNDNPS